MDSEAIPMATIGCVACALAFFSPACDPQLAPDAEVTQFTAEKTKLDVSTVQLLKRIGDKTSAKLVLKELQKLGELNDALLKQETALKKDPKTCEILEKKRQQLNMDLSARRKETLDEYHRLCRLVGVVPLMKTEYPVKSIERKLYQMTEVDLNLITISASTYRTLGGGEFPNDIGDLAKHTLIGMKKPL